MTAIKPIPLPTTWRTAPRELRLATSNEDIARTAAAGQDITGTNSALRAASRAATRGGVALGMAAGIVDSTGGNARMKKERP